MILNLIDGTETVFFALILRAALEDKPVCDLLRLYLKSGKVTDVLSKMRDFAKAKLNHPDLEIVLQEMESLIRQKGERRKGLPAEGPDGYASG